MAHHYTEAGLSAQAIPYWQRAGQRAMARSGYREAVACFEQELVALRRLPEHRDTLEQAIDLRLAMRNALLALGDFQAMFDSLREAETLAKAIGDHRAVAENLGHAYALSGRVAEALPFLEEAASMVRSGQAMYTARLSEAYLLAGQITKARTLAGQTLALARDRKERGFQAWALLGAIASQNDPLETESGEAYYRQALALAEELSMRPLVAHCHLGLGKLYAKIGQREQGRAELSAAIALYRTMEMTFWLPQAEAMLVQVEGQ